MKVLLLGIELKALVAAVTRFPSLGGFVGSDQISLTVVKEKLLATTVGVALSKARVPIISGDLELVGIDERLLAQFAAICRDSAKVVIESDGKEIVLRSGKNESRTPFKKGQKHLLPNVAGDNKFGVDAGLAERVSYLGQVAYNDTSRAELCCVMLTGDGRAMACNQRAVAVLGLSEGQKGRGGAVMSGNDHPGKVALPVPLARMLVDGDQVWVSQKETVVKSGIGWYVMPSPAKAQAEFPLKEIDGYGKLDRELIAVCKGARLARAVENCQACLGGLAKTSITVSLSLVEGELNLYSKSTVADFRARIPVLRAKYYDKSLKIPLDEFLHIIPFVAEQDEVSFSIGKSKEVFVDFQGSWAMFPSSKK